MVVTLKEASRARRDRLALRDAVKACGGRRRFAQIVGVDERTVGRWLKGTRRLAPTARVMAFLVVTDPDLIPLLEGVALAARGHHV